MPRWGADEGHLTALVPAWQPEPGGGRRAAQWGRGCLRGVSPRAREVRWLETLTRDLDP